MSLEKMLLDAGAQCVAGLLVLNQKAMGVYVDGTFVASEDGLEFEATVPVVIKASKGKPAKPKASDDLDSSADLEDLLGE